MGKGVVATVGGAPAWVASPRYAMEHGGLDGLGLRQATIFEEEGKTAVAVFREKTPLGLIAMRDEPRADAKDAVRQLTAMGVTSVILTGDNPRTAAAIAGGLGLEFEADMMPEDKLAYIREIGTRRRRDDDRRRHQRRARAEAGERGRGDGIGHRCGAGNRRCGDPARPGDRHSRPRSACRARQWPISART